MSVFVMAVDGTVLYLAVPALTRDLAPSATEVLWIGDIYALALAGLLIVMGSLADRIGRKKLLLIGSAAFGAASLLAAFAPSAGLLVLARLLLGVAAATLMPSTLSLIRNIFTVPAQRTRAIAIWSAAAGSGAAVGPLVGGLLLEHFWWGSVFLINVPIMALLVLAGLVLLPESKNPTPGRFDLLSALMSMAAIVPMVFAVKHTVAAGPDQVGLLALLTGAAVGTLFVRRQRRLAEPLIDVDLFAIPAFTGAVLATFMAIFALTGLLFFFSQYLQLARGFSPVQAGLAELPATLSSIAVVVLVAWLVRRIGMGRAIAFGLGLVSFGLAMVAFAEGASNYLWLGLALVPVGVGVGLAETLTVDAVVTAAPSRKSGAASAISETAYELGVALGIAVLGSTVTALYRSGLVLPQTVSTQAKAAATDSLASAVQVLPAGSTALHQAQEAFVAAMQVTSLIAAAVTLVGAVIAWRTIPSRVVEVQPDVALVTADSAGVEGKSPSRCV